MLFPERSADNLSENNRVCIKIYTLYDYRCDVVLQYILPCTASFSTYCCDSTTSILSKRNTGNLTLYNVSCSTDSRRFIDDCSFDIVSGYFTGGCHLQEELIVGCYERSNCTEGDLRLVDGNSSMEGRVEVCTQGIWGAIYTSLSSWSGNAARVVCKQLGYPWNCKETKPTVLNHDCMIIHAT